MFRPLSVSMHAPQVVSTSKFYIICFGRKTVVETRVNWGNVGRFLDHNIRHVIARDSPNPTGAFHTSTESVDSLVSKYRPSIINPLVVSQSESRKLYDVILGQSRTERGNLD